MNSKSKPNLRRVLSTRRRAMRKQSSNSMAQRNSTYRMSLLKESELASTQEEQQAPLWPVKQL